MKIGCFLARFGQNCTQGWGYLSHPQAGACRFGSIAVQ